ncbi:hypothetical protein GCM10009123_18100 [Kangiella japonica]|uniref:RNA polymerase sigma-70 factor, ECF subfamily n=2 Tax=Kangiella japonica TaxID=647384 RepID=A0ABN0T3E2_9GAMM
MLRDEHRANDVLQTVMLKMIDSIVSLSDSNKLNGWMKRVCYNSIIDIIRANQRFDTVSDDVVFDYSAKESLSIINSDHWDLEYYLDVLDERERLVVWLYAVEGYSHKELSKKIGITEQNSRVIYSRAMRSLKQLVREQEVTNSRAGARNE